MTKLFLVRGSVLSVVAGAVAVLGFYTSCGRVGLSGQAAGVSNESNDRAELTTKLESWECPESLEIGVSDIEVKPLLRLKNSSEYQGAVAALDEVIKQQPVTLEFGSRSFQPGVCKYSEKSGQFKATVFISKRIVEQFLEDSPRFAEVTMLSLRFAPQTQDGAFDYRTSFSIFTESEGAKTVLSDDTDDVKTLLTKIPSEPRQARIGSYKISLKN
jgi:hypothetical protein